jgi:hypothetical protein
MRGHPVKHPDEGRRGEEKAIGMLALPGLVRVAAGHERIDRRLIDLQVAAIEARPVVRRAEQPVPDDEEPDPGDPGGELQASLAFIVHRLVKIAQGLAPALAAGIWARSRASR